MLKLRIDKGRNEIHRPGRNPIDRVSVGAEEVGSYFRNSMEKIFEQRLFKEENPFEDERVAEEWINSVENEKDSHRLVRPTSNTRCLSLPDHGETKHLDLVRSTRYATATVPREIACTRSITRMQQRCWTFPELSGTRVRKRLGRV